MGKRFGLTSPTTIILINIATFLITVVTTPECATEGFSF